jgi:Flp pilus assembly protein TadG
MVIEYQSRRRVHEALERAATLLRSVLQRKRNVDVEHDRIPEREVRENGMTLVEMAVTLPVLFAFLFCFMELSLAFYTYNMISETAREGTRYAMVHGASCPTSANPTCKATAAQVDAYVLGIGWANLAGGTMTVCTYYNNNACNTNPTGSETVGNPVKVTVTYVFPISMPFVPNNSLTIKSTSQMTIIQ